MFNQNSYSIRIFNYSAVVYVSDNSTSVTTRMTQLSTEYKTGFTVLQNNFNALTPNLIFYFVFSLFNFIE
jgi:hypothetical protein